MLGAGDAQDDIPAEGKPQIKESELKDAYGTMKDFAKMYDYDNMILVLDSLKEYSIDKEDAQLLQKLRDLTEEFKWEEIDGLLKDK